MRRQILAAAALSLSAGCVAVERDSGTGPCPVAGAGSWSAWVDMMPGAKRTLNVAGQVTAPTGGHRIWLERGGLQEIHPPVQQMILRVQRPAGTASQASVVHDVQASFPATASYGSVVVRCGSDVLAAISPVGVAR